MDDGGVVLIQVDGRRPGDRWSTRNGADLLVPGSSSRQLGDRRSATEPSGELALGSFRSALTYRVSRTMSDCWAGGTAGQEMQR